jgi:hypothetical protein
VASIEDSGNPYVEQFIRGHADGPIDVGQKVPAGG